MIKTEIARLPTATQGVYQVWRRNFRQFLQSWKVNLLWIVFEPLLVLLALGYGLGGFVSQIQGVPYISFYFPAFLCISGMLISFFEATYGAFPKMSQGGAFSAMILTPLEPHQIAWGEVLWAATKGTLSSIIIALFGIFLGLVNSPSIFAALVIIFLICFIAAAFGIALTTLAKNYDGIIYPTSGLIIPMTLVCGTYFPLEIFPIAFQYILEALPLTPAVYLVRGLILESPMDDLKVLISLIILMIYAVIFMRWSVMRLKSKLKV